MIARAHDRKASDAPQSRRSRASIVLAVLAIAVLLLVIALIWRSATQPPLEIQRSGEAPSSVTADDVRFVGSDRCQACHGAQFDAWQGSQHQRAMQHASAQTVLADFEDTTFTYTNVTSTFYTRDGKYFVRTDGADGELAEFEIRYTYGVDPLQQYLIEFPDGRLQALSIAWDTRSRADGGQRWFHLYPHERITHTDELHWTGPQQNWNFMCADCHSTDIRKNYDPATDSFATTWAEISVGCEACHGPGSPHIAWAQSHDAEPGGDRGLSVVLDARRSVSWRIDQRTGSAVRSERQRHDREIDVCAQCHSRRSQIAEGYRAGEPFLDHYLPARIDPPLYWANGRQRDEVYIWGSFLQSRMYARGVTCSDCHEPHSQGLRAPGNALCAQCHQPARFDDAGHHFHEPGSPGAECVNCHMPENTYMVIDPRRDHGLRVPRPDESIAYGVPNACNDCHSERTAEWARTRVREWYGDDPAGSQQFTGALASAAQGRASAAPNLVALLSDRSQPQIIRATSVHALARHPDPIITSSVARALNDAHPLVRRGALGVLELYPPDDRVELAAPLLADPVRIVRIEAAYVLAGAAAGAMTSGQSAAFARAAAEFLDVQRYNADRFEAQLLAAGFHARRGDVATAENQYRALIERGQLLPAYVNLADLYRIDGRDADAATVLRAGLEAHPEAATLHHALGLTLVRRQELERALPELARATELEPADARFTYVHAVALHSAGRSDDALEEVRRGLEGHPENRDLLLTAATLSRDTGRLKDAANYTRRLVDAYPQDRAAHALLAEFEAARDE